MKHHIGPYYYVYLT